MYLLPSSMETNLGKATATFTAFQSAAPSSTPFRQIAHPKGIQVFSSCGEVTDKHSTQEGQWLLRGGSR